MLSGRLQQAPGGVEVRRYLSTLLLQMLQREATPLAAHHAIHENEEQQRICSLSRPIDDFFCIDATS